MLMCCLSCAKVDWCKMADRVEDYCINHEERPMTNYDLLISKTPEELAEYLSDIAGWLSEYEGKAHALIKWLKSPVEVDK